MSTLRPGKPARGSLTGRPVMVLLDLLGRRWAMRVIWELRGERALTFRALQAACGDISPTVLNLRLKELTEAGLVTHEDGFRLSAAGRELFEAFKPLQLFADRWGRRLTREDSPREAD